MTRMRIGSSLTLLMLRRGLPPMTVFLKNEYGKEKTDQKIDDAALTNLKNIKPLYSGRPVKWPQQLAFVVIRFLPLHSQNTSIERIFGALQCLYRAIQF